MAPAPRAAEGDIDFRLLLPFLAHVILAQTLILLIRITTSYRSIELGLPAVWLGIIATGFAIVPTFTALWVGRWIDRGNDAKACWIGALFIFAACLGFWLASQSAVDLLAFSVLLGFGHMFCMAGHQMLAVRAGGAQRRESVLGHYMVAASIGQALGPLAVAWLAGSAALAPAQRLFAIGLAAAGASVLVAFMIRPRAPHKRTHASGAVTPIRQLIRVRGFPAVMVASVVTITALDLVVIYLPLLGTERDIDANNIGLLLTARSVAALVSRSFYVRLISGMGRTPLTLASMLGSAAGFLCLAIPASLPAMYAVVTALGFAMGIASTLTISSAVHLAPPHAYGTALTLRMTGNRAGQIVFPALAGLLASATGVAGILVAIGLGLAASAIAVAATQAPVKG